MWLILLIPKGMLAARYNKIPDGPYNSIMAAANMYIDDLTDLNYVLLLPKIFGWDWYIIYNWI